MKPIRDELPNQATPRDHLDEVRLVVRLTNVPTGDVRETTTGLFALWSDPIAVSLEDAARQVTAVAWDEEREIFEPFISNQKYTQYEWGASGTALEFVVEILNGVAVEGVMLGMGYAIAKLRGRRDKPTTALLDTADEATQAAIQATATIFDVDPEGLEVTLVQFDHDSATVVLTGSSQRYRASVRRLSTGDPVLVIERDDS